MQVRHPRADRNASPAAVTVGTTTYPVGEDGVIACPDDEAAKVADVLAGVYDVTPDELVREEDGPPDDDADGTCEAVKSDGDVCGRELPCPYHSDDDSEDKDNSGD